MSGDRDPIFEAWVEQARGVDLLAAAQMFGFRAKGAARPGRVGDVAGPCPRCGGDDRFAVNAGKRLWHCRGAGRGGHDAISLAIYLMCEAPFVEACERLTGETRPMRSLKPETSAERATREAEAAQRDAAARAKREADERAAMDYREAERRRCLDLWRRGAPAPGSLIEAYLRHRAIPDVPVGAKLRLHRDLRLREPSGKDGVVVWSGPAMLAPIADNGGVFVGLHQTWLDPDVGRDGARLVNKGKLLCEVGGARVDVKRSRGTKRGGHLILAPSRVWPPRRIVIGEGIETVLSVWAALRETGVDLDLDAFWCAIDLGNLGGPALRSVKHPTLTKIDARGARRAVHVPGPTPDVSTPDRAIAIPEGVREVLILADGDSDRFTVECATARAAARWARSDLVVSVAWPDDGGDFNDMRMRLVAQRGKAAA